MIRKMLSMLVTVSVSVSVVFIITVICATPLTVHADTFSWTETSSGAEYWQQITSSYDGTKLSAIDVGGYIHLN